MGYVPSVALFAYLPGILTVRGGVDLAQNSGLVVHLVEDLGCRLYVWMGAEAILLAC
jgi:hypothetical protein